jgi:hypothetical protein
MNLASRLRSSTPSFAHLLSRGAPVAAKKRAADPEREEERDEREERDDDERDDKRAESRPDREEEREDEDEDREEKREDAKRGKKAKSKRAAKDDDDEKEDGEDDGKGDDKPNAASPRDADDHDDDDESDSTEMKRGRKGAHQIRLAERARCAAIFADAAAGTNQALAAQLAFGTDLPAEQAVAVLRAGVLTAAAPAPRRNTLDERMASVRIPRVGVDDSVREMEPKSVAQQIIDAGKRRRGEQV